MSYGFLNRAGEAARSSTVAAGAAARRVFAAAEVRPGWLVLDADGLEIGRVKRFEGDYLAVSRGFGRSPLYVPPAGVREVTAGRVRLNLSLDLIDGSRWSEKPRPAH
jgi:hypothetical protein